MSTEGADTAAHAGRGETGPRDAGSRRWRAPSGPRHARVPARPRVRPLPRAPVPAGAALVGRGAPASGAVLGAFTFSVLRIRRRVVLDNLAHAFPGVDAGAPPRGGPRVLPPVRHDLPRALPASPHAAGRSGGAGGSGGQRAVRRRAARGARSGHRHRPSRQLGGPGGVAGGTRLPVVRPGGPPAEPPHRASRCAGCASRPAYACSTPTAG